MFSPMPVVAFKVMQATCYIYFLLTCAHLNTLFITLSEHTTDKKSTFTE